MPKDWDTGEARGFAFVELADEASYQKVPAPCPLFKS